MEYGRTPTISESDEKTRNIICDYLKKKLENESHDDWEYVKLIDDLGRISHNQYFVQQHTELVTHLTVASKRLLEAQGIEHNTLKFITDGLCGPPAFEIARKR